MPEPLCTGSPARWRPEPVARKSAALPASCTIPRGCVARVRGPAWQPEPSPTSAPRAGGVLGCPADYVGLRRGGGLLGLVRDEPSGEVTDGSRPRDSFSPPSMALARASRKPPGCWLLAFTDETNSDPPLMKRARPCRSPGWMPRGCRWRGCTARSKNGVSTWTGGYCGRTRRATGTGSFGTVICIWCRKRRGGLLGACGRQPAGVRDSGRASRRYCRQMEVRAPSVSAAAGVRSLSGGVAGGPLRCAVGSKRIKPARSPSPESLPADPGEVLVRVAQLKLLLAGVNTPPHATPRARRTQ